jgi:hypothetical protein
LKTLLNLLVVVTTVATIAPLSVDRSAGGSDYSENKSQRYQSATKSLLHFSPLRLRWKSATVMPLFLPWNSLLYSGKVPISCKHGVRDSTHTARKEM